LYNLPQMNVTNVKSLLLELAGIILVALVIVGISKVTLSYSIVDGTSMDPTLQNEQRLLVNKISYMFGEPQRGDIIVFPPPAQYSYENDFIKRIVGLPGESVEVKADGTVYINDQPLSEPYVVYPKAFPVAKVYVPEGQYYVMGDNRVVSLDSRYGFFVAREDIVGEAWLSIWPLGEFHFLAVLPILLIMKRD